MNDLRQMVAERLKELGREDYAVNSILSSNTSFNFNPRDLRIITVSRTMGSGAKVIAEQLAKKLGYFLWDKELLVTLANDSRIQKEIINYVDEKHLNHISAYVYSFLGNSQLGSMIYSRQLARTILAVCIKNNAIIIGRGANYIIPNAFHVRIMASLEKRIENMIKYENLDYKSAKSKLLKSDRDRSDFLSKSFDKENDKEFPYDLLFYTDRIPHEDAVDLIEIAFSQHIKRLKEMFPEI